MYDIFKNVNSVLKFEKYFYIIVTRFISLIQLYIKTLVSVVGIHQRFTQNELLIKITKLTMS